MPRFPIFFVARLKAICRQRDRLLSQHVFLGNDVPSIFVYQICREKIERAARIRTTAGDVANVAFIRARRYFESSAFHLHRKKPSRTPHHEVIASRVTPGFADGNSVLDSTRHKNNLRPLATLFIVLDFRFTLFHCLRLGACSQKKERRQPGNLRDVALCCYWTGTGKAMARSLREKSESDAEMGRRENYRNAWATHTPPAEELPVRPAQRSLTNSPAFSKRRTSVAISATRRFQKGAAQPR